MISIERHESDLLRSNMYVIREDTHAIVIDPFRNTAPAEGLTVDRILLTHEHYDHISGVRLWKEATGAPVLCSGACAANIRDPRKNLARHFREFCELQTWVSLAEIPEADPEYRCEADKTFEDEMTFSWMGHRFHLFAIPGHSLGSIGIMLDGKDFFSGDSLMEHSGIELRLPGGSRKKWQEIGRERIARIPEGTMVWPGHFDCFACRGTV